MKARTVAVAVALAAVVSTATACGGSGSTAAPAKPASPHALASAYDASTGAGTAMVDATFTIHTTASTSAAAQTVRVRVSGAIDMTHKSATMHATFPPLGSLAIVLVDGIEYVEVPPSFAGKVPGDKPWLAINLNQATGGTFGSSVSSTDPSQFLSLLQAESDSVTNVGTTVIRGVQVTGYRAVLDLNKAAADRPQAATTLHRVSTELHTTTLPLTVWIDRQSRVRRMRMALHVPAGITSANGTSNPAATVHLTMDVFNYGTPVTVTPPPPDQVYQVAPGSLGSGTSSLGL